MRLNFVLVVFFGLGLLGLVFSKIRGATEQEILQPPIDDLKKGGMFGRSFFSSTKMKSLANSKLENLVTGARKLEESMEEIVQKNLVVAL